MESERVRLDPTLTGNASQSLERNLNTLVVGQPEAIEGILNIYQQHLVGLNPPGRPIGNFLFLGPTGTGKTRIVEATAESLVGNPRAVVKIDCGEFQHSHEIAKLIGSPPGYLGHRETHPFLSQESINQHHTDRVKISFILFDEIEKASDSLWNLLLGILDKAILTLGDNRRVDFSRAMIFMTSNLGAREMRKIIAPGLGFGLGSTSSASDEDKLVSKLEATANEAAKKKFTPEFMNRMDKVVVFKPLTKKDTAKILEIEIRAVQQRIFTSSADRVFVFHLTQEAKEFVLSEGMDSQYGARHLKRAIERLIVQPLSNLIASGQIRPGDLIEVHFDVEELTFSRVTESMSPVEMAQYGRDSLTLPPAASTYLAVNQNRDGQLHKYLRK